MSENDNKTTKRLTIHRSYQQPPQIKHINISLYQQQIHLQQKRKTTFQDPPNYLPKCFPKLQGPRKTPQTSRGPHKITPGPPGDAPKIPPGPPTIVPASPQHPQGPCTELPELPRSISRIPQALSLLPLKTRLQGSMAWVTKWPRRNREAYTIISTHDEPRGARTPHRRTSSASAA